MNASALAWARWWHLGWLKAETSWWPSALSALPAEQLRVLARTHHAELGKAFALPAIAPPPPLAVMTPLLSGPAEQRNLCLALVVALCHPQQPQDLSPAQRDWCLSIARALRPGQWLPQDGDPLGLLRAWIPATVWQRARLAFPRSRIEHLEAQPLYAPPSGRLQALWHAVYWQAQQANLALEPTFHADSTYA